MNSYRRKSDNAEVSVDEAFDDNGAIRDGYLIRTPHGMMDSSGVRAVGHVINDGAYRPTADSYQMTDADRIKVEQIDRHNARLSDAWKTPPASADQLAAGVATVAPAPAPKKTTDMDVVYDRNDRRLEDAWKTA